MLQVLLQRALDGKNYIVESAGVANNEGEGANKYSIQCMEERGIDISGHRSRFVGNLDLREYELIVCCEEGQVEELRRRCNDQVNVMLANSPDGVPNPWGQGREAYVACAETMERVAKNVIAIIGEDENLAHLIGH